MAKSEKGRTGLSSRSSRARRTGFDRSARADDRRAELSGTTHGDVDSAYRGKTTSSENEAASTQQSLKTEQKQHSSTSAENRSPDIAKQRHQRSTEVSDTPAMDAPVFADFGPLSLQPLSIKTVSVDVYDRRRATDPGSLASNSGPVDQNPVPANSTTPCAGDQLQRTMRAFQDQFAFNANDANAFHSLMQTVFGNQYDHTAAESIRQQSLAGEYSWMPHMQITIGSALVDTSGTQGDGIGLAAYDSVSDTIYLSEELLASELDRALNILTEEVGHALDTRVNTADSVGDEGELFAKLMAGENLSEADIAEIRAENDLGTMVIDGEPRAVEYSWLFNRANKTGNAASLGAKTIGGGTRDDMHSVGSAIRGVLRRVIRLFK